MVKKNSVVIKKKSVKEELRRDHQRCQSILPRQGTEFSLKSEYAAHIAKIFRAGAENIDFNDGDGSAKHVNAFVKDNTRGMIPQLVTAESFADSVGILVNAIYFKGEWETQFEFGQTQTNPFHGVAGARDAEFMIASGMYTRYSIRKSLAVVSLAYKDPAYSLVVLMPNGNFASWRSGLTAEYLQAAIEGTKVGKICLSMPKFKIESTTDGKAVLQKLGVSAIFSDSANLSGISDQALYVSRITHKAVIKVTEQGTEAAAVCDEEYDELCEPDDHLRVDKPFMFVLKRHHSILFIGDHC